MEVAGVKIRAVSVGGLETCIELPTWKLCFDIGRCPPTAHVLPRVLFTHAHIDHMGGVVAHCATRDLMGMPPPEYLIPAENEAAFHLMLDAWRKLDRSDLPCRVRGVSPGDVVELGPGREAHVFRAIHRVPALGYALVQNRKRLLPQFHDTAGVELGRLRAAGVTIDEPIRSVEVAFCGDTTIDVVDREPMVRTARVLVLEVTFIDERVTVELARSKGHIHLDEVIARADKFENEAIVFTHFSARHGRQQILDTLARRLPESLRNRVIPLLPEPPWAPVKDPPS